MLKNIYKIVSSISIILGTFLIINSQKSILGYATLTNLGSLPSLSWGAFFLLSGIALLYFTIRK